MGPPTFFFSLFRRRRRLLLLGHLYIKYAQLSKYRPKKKIQKKNLNEKKKK